MNAQNPDKIKPIYIALLLLLVQVILYHSLHEEVVVFNEIFGLPSGAPLILPMLFTIAYGLYSRDEISSFLVGSLSVVISPVDLILTGRYVSGKYSPLPGELSVLFIIGIAFGLLGVLTVKMAKKYALKFNLISFIYGFSGIISTVMGIRIIIELLEYALNTSQWSRDAINSLFLAVGAVILGVISIQWCSKKKYPRFAGNPKLQRTIEWIISTGVFIVILYLVLLVWNALMQPQL
jgi:uncharacterized membrane protein